ncbi:MAG: ribonuclease HII [Pseudomonadota bacterium]
MAARRKSDPSLFPDLGTAPGPWEIEGSIRVLGYESVAGVDEAGRGPLAGPVVAAAVILDPEREYPGVGDSKKIGLLDREKAFRLILRSAAAVSLGIVGPDVIDRVNILRASLDAMRQAVEGLRPQPDFVLVDGPIKAPLAVPQRALTQGDALCLSIGAASIVAKVVRDRLMLAYDHNYPGYGFAAHKGYGTREHLEALTRLGPCAIHRRSFKRVGP